MYKAIIDFIRATFDEKDAYIPLHQPLFDNIDRKYVLEAIDSTFVSSIGKFVDRFEDMIKGYTGAKCAVAIVNGTSALHLSLLLAGVKRNDLVITQPLSFIATCNAISYIGAEPIFIDIDRKTLGLSADKLLDFLKEKTKIVDGQCFHKKSGKRISACVPMHSFGHPAAIDEIVKYCNQFHIVVIEDAAESLGSFYKGKHTGRFGLIGTFSFNGNKTITCGGGGIIITDDVGIGKMAKHLSTQSKIPHKWNFSHDFIGFNYRLPNLNAALACSQMEKLENYIENKRELALKYRSFFETVNIPFFEEPANARSNFWLNVIFMENRQQRNEFLEFSYKSGVMTRPAWTLMNKLDMFKNCFCENISNALLVEDCLVNIPSSVCQKS